MDPLGGKSLALWEGMLFRIHIGLHGGTRRYIAVRVYEVKRDYMRCYRIYRGGMYGYMSYTGKLLVSPFISPIMLPYLISYIYSPLRSLDYDSYGRIRFKVLRSKISR